jgi:hypothetical protein
VPAKRLSMRKIREVLRLGAEGLSDRTIAESVRLPRTTVRRYRRRAREAGVSWPLPKGMLEKETSVFTRRIHKILDEDSDRLLQLHLLHRPDSGDIIQGSGGIRKIRWAPTGSGKRGGARTSHRASSSNSLPWLRRNSHERPTLRRTP